MLRRGFISASGGRVVLESRAEDALSKAAVNQLGVIEAQTLEGSAGSIRLVGDRIDIQSLAAPSRVVHTSEGPRGPSRRAARPVEED